MSNTHEVNSMRYDNEKRMQQARKVADVSKKMFCELLLIPENQLKAVRYEKLTWWTAQTHATLSGILEPFIDSMRKYIDPFKLEMLAMKKDNISFSAEFFDAVDEIFSQFTENNEIKSPDKDKARSFDSLPNETHIAYEFRKLFLELQYFDSSAVIEAFNLPNVPDSQDMITHAVRQRFQVASLLFFALTVTQTPDTETKNTLISELEKLPLNKSRRQTNSPQEIKMALFDLIDSFSTKNLQKLEAMQEENSVPDVLKKLSYMASNLETPGFGSLQAFHAASLSATKEDQPQFDAVMANFLQLQFVKFVHSDDLAFVQQLSTLVSHE